MNGRTPSRASPRRLEGDIKARIRLALGREHDLILFDNPSGVAKYPNGAVVPYGVGLNHRGGSDLIGMFTARDGRAIFVAPEVKSETGDQRVAQIAFERVVRERGGEYALVRSPEEALAWLADLRRRHG